MLGVVGTTPETDFPVVAGRVELNGDEINVSGYKTPVSRGTPALLAAAVKTVETIREGPVFAYLVGDIGLGDGSRKLYRYLVDHLGEESHSVLTFHYLQPDVDWHNRVLFKIQELTPRPVMIADAGFMYAAKMSGQAEAYDLFTPDMGELAFLADEDAPHPFYTRGFILHEEQKAPELIARAYEHHNAARFLLVKGGADLLADKRGVSASVDRPVTEGLEAIGGTGDTLTGILSALVAGGYEIEPAAKAAAGINRLAGYLAQADPGSQIAEIIEYIPEAIGKVLAL